MNESERLAERRRVDAHMAARSKTPVKKPVPQPTVKEIQQERSKKLVQAYAPSGFSKLVSALGGQKR